jgi:hypothetical protein
MPSGRVTVGREEEGREGGAAPGLGFPKKPASVVCLVLSSMSTIQADPEAIYSSSRLKEGKRGDSLGIFRSLLCHLVGCQLTGTSRDVVSPRRL